jgi:16S rRNA (uracil1498-N3)-methyltransferase
MVCPRKNIEGSIQRPSIIDTSMHARFYAPNLDAGTGSVELPSDEAEHLGRVLRLRPGADVRVFDGRGHEYEGRVDVVERSRVVVELGRAVPDAGTETAVQIVLAQALIKGDAMDQVVRDAVMMGVSRIVPLVTGRSELSPARVKESGRVARWQRIAIASVKQCGRTVVPSVAEPQSLAECLRTFEGTARYLLAEPALAPAGSPVLGGLGGLPAPGPGSRVLLIVGPEGGWTSEEASAAVSAGCQTLTLGPRTLRADVAALVGLTALHCFWGNGRVDAARCTVRSSSG